MVRVLRPLTLTLALVAGLTLVACASDQPSADGPDAPGLGDVDEDGEAPVGTEDDDENDADTQGSGDDDQNAAATVAEPELAVMATVAPIADLVRVVGGDRVEVSTLVPAGADSHTYEPRPGDVARLADADAYLGVGLDLNPAALQLAEANVADGAPVVQLGQIALSDDQLVFDHAHGDDGHTHGDDGHTHGDDGHTHGDDGHTHGDDGHTHDDDGHTHDDDGPGPNPHVWTSVRNAQALLSAIADTLVDLDPDGEDVYRANAAAGRDELAALDERIVDAIETIPEGNRVLVTYHDAWTYFARDYGLEFVTAVQPIDFSEPSASEVRDVIDLIREREVVALFGSEVFPTPVMDAIADETDAAYHAELADDALPGEVGDPDHTYRELMRRNAVTIVSGLGGDPAGLEG